MFCYQCEQTAKGTGCTVQGVCGKQPDVAALQDLLLYTLMGLSQVAVEGRKHGVTDGDVNVFTVQASFSTLTNVNFDPQRLESLLGRASAVLDKARTIYSQACENAGCEPATLPSPASWEPAKGLDGLVAQGEGTSIDERQNLRV